MNKKKDIDNEERNDILGILMIDTDNDDRYRIRRKNMNKKKQKTQQAFIEEN